MAVRPHLEIEQSVLGLLMEYPETADMVLHLLSDDCFHNNAHRVIFTAIRNLYEESKPFNIIAVSFYLDSQDQIKRVGGRAYIAGLTQAACGSTNIKYYCDILLKYSAKTKVENLAHQMLSDSKKPLEDIQTDIVTYSDILFEILQPKNSDSIGGEELANRIWDNAELAYRNKGKIGIQTGFKRIDDRIVGLLPGNYMIIGGRPSVGKSAFGLNMFSNIVFRQKIPALYISLEMSAQEIGLRLLSSLEAISGRLIITGKIFEDDKKDDRNKFLRGKANLDESKLRIVDTAGLTSLDIMTLVRRDITRYNIKIVFIDYLQKIRGGKSFSNKTEELGYISDHLQVMAKELQIPVVALSQLNRDMERGNRSPVPSDLRGSGDLEQDADFILMLHRERGKDGQLIPETDAYLNKGRNRGEETFYFLFKEKLQRFIPAKLEKDGEITNYIPEFDPDDNIPEAMNNYYKEVV